MTDSLGAGYRLGDRSGVFCPVVWLIDQVEQFAQAPVISAVEGKGQARHVAKFGLVLLRFTVRLLLEITLRTQVVKRVIQLLHGGFTQRMVKADNETFLEPAAGVEVAVELSDFFGRLFGAVHQAHKVHITGQDVTVVLQLFADKL